MTAINRIIRIIGMAAALIVSGSAFAQQYPTRPVRIIVPFPPGGVTDIIARLIGQKLQERLGQQFYVENQAGAGGNLGMGNAAHAAADGYTILFSSSSFVVNPSLFNRVPYDAEKDFIPVIRAGATPNAWIVNPDFPAKSMPELIALIKANPGTYSVASPGIGTTPHLSIDMLRLALGLDFITVPFSGGGPMTQSVLAGHTPISCGALGNAMSLLKGGKLRALAVTSGKRSAAMPEVPTLNELGIKGQEAETMQGIFVPAGTPDAIVELLHQEIAAIVSMPDIKERMLELGVEAEGDSSAAFAAYIKDEIAKWKKLIDVAKINKI
jgi:tripartite-type tricarboxylate transporter receptor subunit TctC